MHAVAAPMLERHRVFHSRDTEETRAFVTRRDFRFEFIARDPAALDVRINAAYFPGIYIGYMYYGRAIALEATPARPDYRVQFPIRRRFAVDLGALRVPCDARRGAVLSPMHDNLMRTETGCARFVLSLNPDVVVRQLAALLDGAVSAPPEFIPALDLTTGHGRSLAGYVRAAAADLDHGDSMLSNPLAMSQFEQFVVTALLLFQPHNYTAVLQCRQRPVAPRDIKRAVDYIRDNLHAPITLPQLVQASGVPGRTLLKHFRDATGLSPMAYVRQARYERARQALEAAGPEESVSAIAGRWGFDHMGRFALGYRKRFGERPSDTLARGRRAS